MPYRFALARALVGMFALTAVALTWLILGASATRAVPAAPLFTVNSTADVAGPPGDVACETAPGDNICTLRAAIMAANHVPGGGASIRVPDGLYRLTIAPTGTDDEASGDLNLSAGMVITGAGQGLTVIDGNGSVITDHVLSIATTARVTIAGVTIQNGRSTGDGGGIANSGILTLSLSVVQGNVSLSASHGGGGIYNAGILHLVDSTVFGNVLDGNSINIGGGGGIFNSGTLSLDRSTVMLNSYSQTGPLNAVGGGGIFNSGTLSLDQSTIMSNTESVAVAYGGGGIFSYNGTLSVSASTIIGNQTVNCCGAGGGIATVTGVFTLTDSTVADNRSGDAAGGILDLYTTATIEGSTVSGNTSASAGGGILTRGLMTVTNSTLSGNTAGASGGGIWNEGFINVSATLSLYNATVAFNTAGLGAHGGGIYNAQALVNAANTLLDGNVHATSTFPFHAFDDCGSDTFTSLGYNLISTTAGCTITGTTTGNILNQSALLGPLRNNGGPTETHALLAGSPAIDAGHPGTMLISNGCRDALGALMATDQRGFARPANGGKSLRCDIGAFEYYAFGLFLPLIWR